MCGRFTNISLGSCIIVMIIAVKRAVKGVHEKVINYLDNKDEPLQMGKRTTLHLTVHHNDEKLLLSH